jgi:hypothetical protein
MAAAFAGSAVANQFGTDPSTTEANGASSTVYGAPIQAEQPVYSSGSAPTYVYEQPYRYDTGPVYVTPPDQAVVVAPSDEPRYTPETGNAEYGSKLNPHGVGPFTAAPPARFNDATGQ